MTKTYSQEVRSASLISVRTGAGELQNLVLNPSRTNPRFSPGIWGINMYIIQPSGTRPLSFCFVCVYLCSIGAESQPLAAKVFLASNSYCTNRGRSCVACFCLSLAGSNSVPAYGILGWSYHSDSGSSRKGIILHHDLHYHHVVRLSDFMTKKFCNRARLWPESLVTTLILLLDLLAQFLRDSPFWFLAKIDICSKKGSWKENFIRHADLDRGFPKENKERGCDKEERLTLNAGRSRRDSWKP